MIFKKGDKVYDYAYGWGEVANINEVVDYYPLLIEFQHIELYYNFKGVAEFGLLPTLAFDDYTLEGFSQVRPKEPLPFKEGDVVYVSDNATSRWATGVLTAINKKDALPFVTSYSFWKYLALENPLLKLDTLIYTKEDL